MTMKVENNLSCPPELVASLDAGAKLGLNERDFRAEALLKEYRTNGQYPSYEDSLTMQGAAMKIHHANEAALCESIKTLTSDPLSDDRVKQLEAQVGEAPRTWAGYGSRKPDYMAEMLTDPKKAEALEDLTKHLISSQSVDMYTERLSKLSPEIKQTLNEYMHQRLFPGELKLGFPTNGNGWDADYLGTSLYKAASSMFSMNGLDAMDVNKVFKAIDPSAPHYKSPTLG